MVGEDRLPRDEPDVQSWVNSLLGDGKAEEVPPKIEGQAEGSSHARHGDWAEQYGGLQHL